jgi:hypothetical protein
MGHNQRDSEDCPSWRMRTNPCLRQFVKNTEMGDMGNSLERPSAKLIVENFLKAYRSHLSNVQLIMTKYVDQELTDWNPEVVGGKEMSIHDDLLWRCVHGGLIGRR